MFHADVTSKTQFFFVSVCKLPMGVENHLIVKDQQLSASSSKDAYTGPERARLYGDKDGSFAGAWVPR